MVQINPNDANDYIPYTPGIYSEHSKKNVLMCKYYCMVPKDNGWSKISYFYDKK